MLSLQLSNMRVAMARLESQTQSEWVKLGEAWEGIKKDLLDITLRYGSGKEVDMEEILELNVGGQSIDVRRSTLTWVEGTRLAAMFSGRWDGVLKRDKHGRLAIASHGMAW